MNDSSAFAPEWIVPPGAVIYRAMLKKRIRLEELADKIDLDIGIAKGIVEGSIAIDTLLAEKLSVFLGSTPSFWKTCQSNFDDDRELHKLRPMSKKAVDWCKSLPIKEMNRLGWILQHDDIDEQVRECMRFFGVFDIEDWQQRYAALLSGANYRTSAAFSSEPTATASWLRSAEKSADQISCSVWNPRGLKESLDVLRGLSRIHNPRRFVPMLTSICAKNGVAFVLMPTPVQCKASGAAFFIREDKAVILLSFRYFVDDHFWFTFFHELGHLLLHENSRMFIEGGDDETDRKEEEANNFAREVLVPRNRQDQMLALPQKHDAYIRLALQLGVAPGILVGQMQYRGKLKFSHLNRLKRRYDWERYYKENLSP